MCRKSTSSWNQILTPEGNNLWLISVNYFCRCLTLGSHICSKLPHKCPIFYVYCSKRKKCTVSICLYDISIYATAFHLETSLQTSTWNDIPSVSNFFFIAGIPNRLDLYIKNNIYIYIFYIPLSYILGSVINILFFFRSKLYLRISNFQCFKRNRKLPPTTQLWGK